MNEQNNIDKLFREGLSDLRFSPRENAWENIMAGVGNAATTKSKNYKKYIIYFSGVAATISVLLAFYLRSCEIEATQLPINSRIVANKNSNTEEISQESNSNTKGSIIAYTTHITDNQATTHSKPNYQSNQPLKTNNSTAPANIAKSGNQEPIKDVAQVEQAISFDTRTNNTSNPLDQTSVNSEPYTSLDEEALTPVETIVPAIALEPAADKTENEEVIPFATKKPEAKKVFSVGAHFGMTALSPTGFDVNQEIAVVKDKISIASPNTEAGIELRYNFGKFNISSGLNISQFAEKHSFDYTVEKHDTSGGYLSYQIERYWTYKIVGTIEDPYDPTIYYYIYMPVLNIDTMSSQWNSADKIYYTKENLKSINRYRYLEVPFMLGYSFGIQRFSIDIAGGASATFKIAESGYSINQDNELAKIGENDFTVYNNNNFNVIASTGVRYNLSENFSFGLTYNFRKNITSIYKPEYDNGILYSSQNASLNILYKLN